MPRWRGAVSPSSLWRQRYCPVLAALVRGDRIVHGDSHPANGAPGYALAARRHSPICAPGFSLTTRREIDRPLVLGAVLFGMGWGLVGYCPGPALAGIGLG